MRNRKKWLTFRALTASTINGRDKRPWTHVALAACVCVVVTLCVLNDHLFSKNAQLQNMLQACFCLIAAAMYALYMFITRMLRLILSYSSDHLALSPYTEEHHHQLEKIDEEEEGEPPTTTPREAIISSMYSGGAGAFLAIQPLCMWSVESSAAFLLTLLLIAACTELSRQRVLMLLSTFATVLLVLLPCQTPTLTTTWPRVLLAAASPLLLKGGTSSSSFYHHTMTPSETLETGLPVSSLLAILVLCWYSPLDEVVAGISAALQPWTFVPLLVIAPPYLAAILSLILYSFRARCCGVAAAVLSAALAVRQFFVVADVRGALVAASLSLVFAAFPSLVDVLVAYYYYRRSGALAVPPSDDDEDLHDQDVPSQNGIYVSA